MAQQKNKFKCRECGFVSPNWMGRCSNCGSWNSMEEIAAGSKEENNPGKNKEFADIKPTPISELNSSSSPRQRCGIGELDRVLGGGVVSGSMILLGGAPGIGKSTLVLQAAYRFSQKNGKVLYVSAEESAQQIELRARRLEAISEDLLVLGETNYEKVEGLISNNNYSLVIIDSIQTIYDSRSDTSPGSISQIKTVTNSLLKIAKKKEVPVFLIGHVTKKGELAGPRVLEHLVDVVLQLEGDRNYRYRILRAVKNRYGSTNEIGVFSMQSDGIEEVKNPSQLFLQERPDSVSGSVVAPVLEGTRIILVEVQALVSAAAFSSPQRVTTGLDSKRVSILLAVLEKKAGFSFQSQDVHLNVTGGLKVSEPALDLPIITSIISSERDFSLPPKLAVIGEIGLSGEIRAVNRIKNRIQEAAKLDFEELIIPEGNLKNLKYEGDLKLTGAGNINEIMDLLFA